MKITTLIFDFGGVIYDIDFTRAKEAFENLGIPDFDVLYSKARQSGIFEAFERGEINTAGFCKALHPYFTSGEIPNDEHIIEAWNRLLTGFQPRRIDFLKELRREYELILLSNTNEVHYRRFTAEYEEQFGAPLESSFDEVFFSHRCGMRKPEPGIYRRVIDAAKGSPRSTLFIDDTPHNLPPAEELGIHTQLHDSSTEITETLPDILTQLNQ